MAITSIISHPLLFVVGTTSVYLPFASKARDFISPRGTLKKTSADLTTQLYGEHRRLSIDEFELQLTEFYQLKTDLSLIGEFD